MNALKPGSMDMSPMPKLESIQRMPVTTVESEYTFTGGAKKIRKSKKSGTKKVVSKKGPSKKKGGALMDDVKNLAVPFAILLAKEGLSKMFSKKPATAAAKPKSRSTIKVSGPARRRTVTGGSCGSQCSMRGGEEQQEEQQWQEQQEEEEQEGGKGRKPKQVKPLKRKPSKIVKKLREQEEDEEEEQEGGKGGVKGKKEKKGRKSASFKGPSKRRPHELEEEEEQQGGEQLKQRFKALSDQIDNFLKKY